MSKTNLTVKITDEQKAALETYRATKGLRSLSGAVSHLIMQATRPEAVSLTEAEVRRWLADNPS